MFQLAIGTLVSIVSSAFFKKNTIVNPIIKEYNHTYRSVSTVTILTYFLERKELIMNLNDLIIDPASLGKKLLLIDIKPIHEYHNGVKKEDIIIGYRYTVVCVEKNYDKISIRIDNPLPELHLSSAPEEVIFTGLTIKAYHINGAVNIVAKADGVKYAKKGES